jgi:hypothetical protein
MQETHFERRIEDRDAEARVARREDVVAETSQRRPARGRRHPVPQGAYDAATHCRAA